MNWKRRHSVSGAYVFLLLGMFALLSMLLVLLGAQAYRSGVERTERLRQTRVLQAFVRNAVRGEDARGAIGVEELEGIPVLTVTSQWDEERYVRYLYCYDGQLRELFTAERNGFRPEDGEGICDAARFQPVLEGGLLTVEVTDDSGESFTVSVAPRCQG